MMTLAQIQNQIKNQAAKIAEHQQELLDAQKELSLLLEKKKIMEELANEKLKEAAQLLREAQTDLECTTEEILEITKSKMISPELEDQIDLEQNDKNSLILGTLGSLESIEIDLGKSELSLAEGKQELVNALTEKIDEFEFALSCLPVEERDCARVKLQTVIGNFVNQS
ncbi:hypothetical protein [Dolichospermum compactum]|uniref:Uncharacterized protein n=1 Tax=Dolichospermum compactum NIES-806 TaxID=1973481 RepID=A0A1Z4V4L6_9CYAN|nr:hypothetical protein [Dolichospermum compactum]BAZ86373.1 hypothetical protein NIES806_25850 [Dolichospermum compactum NIES-806]